MIAPDPGPGAANVIKVTDRHAWVYLTIYVPNVGPLKAPQPSQDCYPVRSMNKFADVRALLQLWFPDGSDLNQASDHDDVLPDDRIWFAPPWNPPMLLMPSPDNKYLVATPGPRAIPIQCKASSNAIIRTPSSTPRCPPRADFTITGRSTQKIMGDYYPVAVWCDKYVFEHGGWRACLRD